MKGSRSEEEAKKLFRSQMRMVNQPETAVCRSGYYAPGDTPEPVEPPVTQLLSTDENGNATARIVIPANAKNFKVVALLASGERPVRRSVD